MCYSDDSGIQANANAKAFVWSGKFTPKIRSENGKLSSIGCHFPPKLTNFGTLLTGTMLSMKLCIEWCRDQGLLSLETSKF